MSLNPSTKMLEAARELNSHPAMAQFMAEHAVMTHKMVLNAIKAPADFRMDMVTYARAQRDWHVMLKAALLGKMPNQVELDDTEKDVDQVPAKTPPTPPGRATR